MRHAYLVLLLLLEAGASPAVLRGGGIESGAFVKAAAPPGAVSYTASGSLAGIEDFAAGQIDVALVDRALTREELDQAGRQVWQVPFGIAPVSVLVNIPGVADGALQLDYLTLAAIYSCQITTWTDPAISKLNPGLKINSNATIVPLAYDMTAAPSVMFFRYLALDPSWSHAVNTRFPACMRSTTQAQAPHAVLDNEFSIAYVPAAANLAAKLPRASLASNKGTYLLPEDGTVVPDNLPMPPANPNWTYVDFARANSSTAGIYPVASFSYVLMNADLGYLGYTRASILRDMVSNLLSDGIQANLTQHGLGPINLLSGNLITMLQRAISLIPVGQAGDESTRDKPGGSAQSNKQVRRITGAGDSYVVPIVTGVMSNLTRTLPNVSRSEVSFVSMGAPQAVTYVLDSNFDWAVSAGPAPDSNTVNRTFLAFPFFIAATRVIINLPGLENVTISLGKDVLARIYSCSANLTSWNDPAIAALNPNIKLPDLPLRPRGRLDDADVNYIFSKHLMSSSKWTGGAATSQQWPSCVHTVTSDAAMVDSVRDEAGALGFIMQGAPMCPMPCAAVQSVPGDFYLPTTAAMERVIPKRQDNLTLAGWQSFFAGNSSPGNVTNSAYPMTALHLVYTDAQAGGLQTTPARSQKVHDFMLHLLSEEVQASLAGAGFFHLFPEALGDLRTEVSQALTIAVPDAASSAQPPLMSGTMKGMIAAFAVVLVLLGLLLVGFMLKRGRDQRRYDAEAQRRKGGPGSTSGWNWELPESSEALHTKLLKDNVEGTESIVSPLGKGMRMRVIFAEDLPDALRDSENPTAGEIGPHDTLPLARGVSLDSTGAAAGPAPSQDSLGAVAQQGEGGHPHTPVGTIITSRNGSSGLSEEERGSGVRLRERFGSNNEAATCTLVDTLKKRALAELGDLERGPLVGKGSFGEVFKCRWRGGTVALKVLQHSGCQVQKLCVLRESLLAANVQHPNVLTTFKAHTILHSGEGVRPRPKPPLRSLHPSTEEPELVSEEPLGNGVADILETWLVSEFCDQGNLESAIQSKRFEGKPEHVLLCLMDIASGMEYMHSLGILHADLKPGNVLLKANGATNYDPRGYTCKLGDFGLSRVLENSSTHVSITQYGTLAFMPPEVLQSSKVNKATDIYSFSMIMVELWTGERVFRSLQQHQIMFKVFSGKRPKVDFSKMPREYAKLLNECWSMDPALRPPFRDILVRLRTIYSHLGEEPEEGAEYSAGSFGNSDRQSLSDHGSTRCSTSLESNTPFDRSDLHPSSNRATAPGTSGTQYSSSQCPKASGPERAEALGETSYDSNFTEVTPLESSRCPSLATSSQLPDWVSQANTPEHSASAYSVERTRGTRKQAQSSTGSELQKRPSSGQPLFRQDSCYEEGQKL